jgi:uncharacterized protein
MLLGIHAGNACSRLDEHSNHGGARRRHSAGEGRSQRIKMVQSDGGNWVHRTRGFGGIFPNNSFLRLIRSQTIFIFLSQIMTAVCKSDLQMIREISFPSEGAMLRGLLFLPETQARRVPLVIMAHGTSATIHMVADKYAEEFCLAGFAVLLYDHRNFGNSGGEPRQQINPWIQSRGFRDAINFAQQLEEVDVDRIGLWGDSYSGGEVIVVGAIDERVKVVVAQCPVCGVTPPEIEANIDNFQRIKDTLLNSDFRGSPEVTTGPIPVVSSDQVKTPSLLKPIQAFYWFTDYGDRPNSGWINSVTRVIPATPVPFNPVLCAPFLKVPALMMVAPEDEMVHANYAVARLTYKLITGPKQWYDIAGGHFGLLYFPSELFNEAVRVQTAFFVKWLFNG